MKNIVKFSLLTIMALAPVVAHANEKRCQAIDQVPEAVSDVLQLIRELPIKDTSSVQNEVAQLEKKIVDLSDPSKGISGCNTYSDEMLKQAYTALQDVQQGFSTEFGPEIHSQN